MPEPLIQVEGLTKYHDLRPAIQDVTFSVPRGQLVGLLGPNGAGKSTILRILAGSLGPSAGKATIAGFDVTRRSMDARRRVGYLPDPVPLYDEMRVAGFLDLMCRLRGVAPSRRRGRVDHAIAVCGLADRRTEIVGRLPVDLRRRVGLAQAAVHDPEVLILDEPTAGLGDAESEDVRDLIKELGRGRTVILSSHVVADVSSTCGRVLTFNEGRLLADDTPAGLAERISGARGHEIEILVRGEAERLEATLRAVEGVDDVVVTEATDDLTRAVVTVANADLREELGRIVVEAGFGLRELHARSLTIEGVLRSLKGGVPE